MTNLDWQQRISKLPPSLTIGKAARRLRQSYQSTRLHLLRCGYEVVDGRKHGKSSRLDLKKIDWNLSNIAIARSFLVSKQRVSFLRKQLGINPVESRGRPKKAVKP